MTSNRAPSGRNASGSGGTPSRRSTHQQLSHEPNRAIARASTRGGGGPARNPIVLYSAVAVVVAVVLIGAAWVLTQPKAVATDGVIPPGVTTPSGIPANGETLGKADAPVTVDLYSDFRCTGCFDFYIGSEPKLIGDFVQSGQVKIVYKNVLQIDAIDAQNGSKTTASLDTANAGMCAADQGKFWQYHDWVFANNDPQERPESFTKDRLIEIAKAAGVDNATFEDCVKSGKHNAEVQAEDKAKPSAVTGTPKVFVNGKLVSSAYGDNYVPTYDEIAFAINVALGKATPAPTITPTPSASASAAASATPAATASPTAAPSPSPSPSAS